MQNMVYDSKISDSMYHKINYVLNLPYVEGIPFEKFSKDSSNEMNILLGLCKSYQLLSIKQNKKRRFDIQQVKDVTLYFVSQINKWNIKSIIDILLDRNKCSDVQNYFYLEIIEYLIENSKTQIRFYLIELIEDVNSLMSYLKKEIKIKANNVMNKLLRTSNNSDLDPFIPILLASLKDFNQIPEAIEQLAGCVFVQNVELPALSVILPILEKGLKNNITEIKRKSCVIIDNMCKLIEDPKEIYPILPKIRPLIESCANHISNPEARSIAEKCLKTVDSITGKDFTISKFESIDIEKILMGKILVPDDITYQNVKYMSIILTEVINCSYFEYNEWLVLFNKYLPTIDNRCNVCQNIFNEMKEVNTKKEDKFIDNEEGADLYKGEFSLAYGALTLLNNTYIHLKKNRFYGLLGPNNCGKTTLMRAIANEQVEGFPKRDELKTIFVEHEIQEREVGEDDKGYPIFNIDLCGIDWVVDCCNEIYKMEPKVTREQVEQVMDEIGFGNSKKNPGKDRAADAEMGVTTYSGGWKMKMQLCAATLMNADILMLDEPTGHLDIDNIKWLKDWLNNFKNKGGSIICTSHDSSFLNDMCSHIIDFQNRKLVMFRDKEGDVLKKFVDKYPEKKGYFELKNDVMKFEFPDPGSIDGKKSGVVLKMKDVTFQYPIRDKPTVMNISLSCSTSSRVAVIGPNGAGKSTAIKLLIGELKPTEGDVWKNPNARIAYVAQHAFQHLEKHIKKTPTEYILWRFAGNDDKESVDFKADINEDEERVIVKYYLRYVDLTYEVTKCKNKEEEKKALVLNKILNKKKNKKLKTVEYEVSWKGLSQESNTWVKRDILINMGCIQEVQRFDEKMAVAAGLIDKTLTCNGVEKHLLGFGIEPEQASHTLIGSLSGGQKVKVVLAASLWQNPHLIILDEPTNYLDRDGLGALTKAIEEFKGGVIIISHNREFANAVAQEKWIMEKGRLRREGESTANQEEEDKSMKPVKQNVIKDKFGNEIKVEGKLSDKEKKKKLKSLQKELKTLKKRKASQDEIYEIEEMIDNLKDE